MKRIYKLPDYEVLCNGNANSLITNGYGSYFSYLPLSNYTGWYLLNPKNWEMLKIIESITPLDVGKQEGNYTQYYGIRRKFQNGEDIIFPYNKSLFYDAKKIKGKILLTLDQREIYQESELGRNYHINIENNYVIITFTKESQTNYLVIKNIKDINIINNWREKNYQDDQKRNSQSIYWVYDALEFKAKSNVVFSFSQDLSTAKTRADIAATHFEDVVNSKHTTTLKSLPKFDYIKDKVIRASAISAFWSMNNLINSFEFDHKQFPAIYAGLPWFFQVWSRDELIGLSGLIHSYHHNVELPIAKSLDLDLEIDYHNLHLTKIILERYLNNIFPNGTLKNRFPKSQLGSIDAFGWLGKRILDFIIKLQKDDLLFQILNDDELKSWFDKLNKGLENAKRHYGKKGLFANARCETWMDTTHGDSGRPGYSIEIQALFLSLYDALVLLAKIVNSEKLSSLKKQRKEFLNIFKQQFILKEYEGILIDNITPKEINSNDEILTNKEKISDLPLDQFTIDRTIRPNIFLTAYLAPDLLSKKEWEKVFDFGLNNLYQEWGGISTISKEHGLYQPTYTGQDNKSYHRGDSWYFINNITALILYTFNKDKYLDKIKKILNASAKDILEEGFSGHASEVSSSEIQDANGTGLQLWSNTTYLELIETLFKKDD